MNIIDRIDQTLGTSLRLDDWFDLYLGRDNIVASDVCTNVPFDARQSNREQACSGPTKFWNQVTKVATTLLGGAYASTYVSSSNVGSFCVPKVQITDEDAATVTILFCFLSFIKQW